MTQNQSPYRTRKFHDALDDLLDRPIAYNPAFKRLTHSTVASIFLSQCWYWSKRHPDDDGWFYKTQKEWEEETGLTRSEQETARRHCREIGVVEEKLKGVPATLFYRVVREKVYSMLGIQFAGFPQTEIAGTPQASLEETGKSAGKLQSDVPADFNRNAMNSSMIPPTGDDKFAALVKIHSSVLAPPDGIITAQILGEMADEYPEEWFEPAYKIAVENNARSLKYVKAVLKGWKDHWFGWKPGDRQGNPTQEKRKPAPPPEDDGLEMVTPEMLKRAREKVSA